MGLPYVSFSTGENTCLSLIPVFFSELSEYCADEFLFDKLVLNILVTQGFVPVFLSKNFLQA